MIATLTIVSFNAPFNCHPSIARRGFKSRFSAAELKKTTLLSFLDISGRCQKLHFQKQSLSSSTQNSVWKVTQKVSSFYAKIRHRIDFSNFLLYCFTGITNYPIGVGINAAGEVIIADNHNNFNLSVFSQEGQLLGALESKVKHAQCFDVSLMDDGSVVLASKDYRLYIYRYIQQVPPIGM